MYFFIHVMTFILKFYHFGMAVRIKMCEIDTVNGTLGLERGFVNELPGPEFILGYIKFAFPRE